MVMTDEQKYSEVLKALGEVLAENSTTISTQSWQINRLKERLAEAEKAIEEAEKERDAAVGRAMRLDTELLDALCEIEKMKGGAA